MKNYFFCLFFLGAFAYGQEPYKWINIPYYPQDAPEFNLEEYQHLHGNVKRIEENRKDIHKDWISEDAEITVECAQGGRLHKITKLDKYGTMERFFTYTTEGILDYQVYLYGLKSYEEKISDTLYYKNKPSPDSLRKDANGNIVYSTTASGNTVYTSYDDYGRKIRDSIPSGQGTSLHIVTYAYKKKKIVRLENYPKEKIMIKTIYHLDSRGNWIRKTVKSNRKVINAKIIRTITYYDEQ